MFGWSASRQCLRSGGELTYSGLAEPQRHPRTGTVKKVLDYGREHRGMSSTENGKECGAELERESNWNNAGRCRGLGADLKRPECRETL